MAIHAIPSKPVKSVQPDPSVFLPLEALFSTVGPIKTDPLSQDQEKELYALFTQTVNDLTGSPHDFLAQIGATEKDSIKERITKAYCHALNLSGASPKQLDEVTLKQALNSMRTQAENLTEGRLLLWANLAEKIDVSHEMMISAGLDRTSGIAVASAFLKWMKDHKSDLGTIRRLHLTRDIRIKLLPPEIGLLSQLEHLGLKGHRLKNIPQSLSNLGSLRSLLLEENDLESVPDFIGGFAKLETLDLSNNRLKSMPDSIGGLANLQTLKLDSNGLWSLPNSIGGLAKLEYLSLRWNHFVSLPNPMKDLEALRFIDLSGWQQTLPRVLKSKLEYIVRY